MSDSNGWRNASIREMLDDEFPGAWGNTPDGGQGNALALRSTNIDDVGNIEYRTGAERVLSESKLQAKALKTGDIILEGSGGGKGKPVGRVALFEHPGDGRTYVCSNFFRTLRPSSEVDSRFLFWRLLHYWRQPSVWAHQQQTTSIINLKHKHYLATEFEWPSLSEQRRIADVLDTVDAAIRETDDVIAKQEQVKTGLLQDLLTRGLDAEGQLRDPEANPEAFRETGLGLLPQTWEVVEMGSFLNEIQAGKSPSCPDIPAASGEWGVVKVSAIKPKGFDSTQNKVIVDEQHIRPEYEIKDGDLITSRANTAELVEVMCLVRNPQPQLLLSDKSLRLVLNEDMALPEFILQVAQTPEYRRQVEIAGTGSSGSMKNISQKNIRNFRLPLPPIDEQKRIVDRLDSTSNRRQAEHSYRTKLKGLKTGLMQDLLTGRVRVPEAKERVEEITR